jgi:hypothetical protein
MLLTKPSYRFISSILLLVLLVSLLLFFAYEDDDQNYGVGKENDET